MSIKHYTIEITYLLIHEPYKLVSLMSSCNYRYYLDGKSVEVDLQESGISLGGCLTVKN